MPHIGKLLSQNFEVVILSPIDEYISYLNKPSHVKHVPLRFLFPQRKNPFLDFLFCYELWKTYKDEKPDLVINFTIKPNIYGGMIGRLLNIPIINVVTGLGYPFLHPTGINKIIPLLYKLSFARIKKLITYNKEDRSEFIKRKIVPAEKCFIVNGSGVNTNRFRPSFNSKKNSPFVFIFIGRLLQDKGILEFVKAAKDISELNIEVEFWVIGNFTYSNPSAIKKEDLWEWVENGYIKYFGFANDVRKYLSKADVMVLPSHRGEGVPRSIIEAMSMGKPIITTDSAGCQDTVEHGENGLLVPVDNEAALKEAMLYLFNTSEKDLEKMGRKSRLNALQKFDVKIITDQFINIVNSVLAPENYNKDGKNKLPLVKTAAKNASNKIE